MTVEDCRTILKVYIRAVEASGKMEAAFAMPEVLDAIDYHSRNLILPENIHSASRSVTMDAPKD